MRREESIAVSNESLAASLWLPDGPGPIPSPPRRSRRCRWCGHFNPYRGEWFERFVGDQTEFLLRHLTPAG